MAPKTNRGSRIADHGDRADQMAREGRLSWKCRHHSGSILARELGCWADSVPGDCHSGRSDREDLAGRYREVAAQDTRVLEKSTRTRGHSVITEKQRRYRENRGQLAQLQNREIWEFCNQYTRGLFGHPKGVFCQVHARAWPLRYREKTGSIGRSFVASLRARSSVKTDPIRTFRTP